MTFLCFCWKKDKNETNGVIQDDKNKNQGVHDTHNKTYLSINMILSQNFIICVLLEGKQAHENTRSILIMKRSLLVAFSWGHLTCIIQEYKSNRVIILLVINHVSWIEQPYFTLIGWRIVIDLFARRKGGLVLETPHSDIFLYCNVASIWLIDVQYITIQIHLDLRRTDRF